MLFLKEMSTAQQRAVFLKCTPVLLSPLSLNYSSALHNVLPVKHSSRNFCHCVYGRDGMLCSLEELMGKKTFSLSSLLGKAVFLWSDLCAF
jgi:hypothetical protein